MIRNWYSQIPHPALKKDHCWNKVYLYVLQLKKPRLLAFCFELLNIIEPIIRSYYAYLTVIYWHKKDTSASHLCLFIPNKCSYFIQWFCFNNDDHLTMLCTKQKSIRWSLTPITTPQAPVPKFRKSQNQYLVCPPFSLTVAVHPCLTERTHFWIVMSARCISCCCDRWHKSDVTKRRSRPCIVTRIPYMVGRSVGTPVAFNISQKCLIVWDVFSNCQAACSIPKSRQRHFCGRLDMVFR